MRIRKDKKLKEENCVGDEQCMILYLIGNKIKTKQKN